MKDLEQEFPGGEYIYKREEIYEQQKEYRKTPEGKLALKRAREKQRARAMRRLLNNNKPFCQSCDDEKFETLTISDGQVLCYNCKYEREEILYPWEIDLNANQ